MTDLVPIQPQGTVALVSEMRRMLAEARLLPDIRRIIEAAKSLEDATRRHAKLAEAEGLAVEAVQEIEAAAIELSLLSLDAKAKAGEIIEEMDARGELVPSGLHPNHPGGPASKATRRLADQKTMAEIVGEAVQGEGDSQKKADARAFKEIDTWRKIARVPAEVRATYVRQAQGKATVAGLLRFAHEPGEPRESTRDDVEVAYDDVVALLGKLTRYNPEIIAGHSTNTNRRAKFRKLLEEAEQWVEKAQQAFGR